MNADGTVSVNVLLPFVDNFDPSTIGAMLAYFVGIDYQGTISFAYVDKDGNVSPITAKAAAPEVTPLYLQISFKANSLAELKKGSLSKLEYWIKEDATVTTYTQTFVPELSFNAMPMTDATPSNPPVTRESKGGGCNAGLRFAGMALVLAAVSATHKRKK